MLVNTSIVGPAIKSSICGKPPSGARTVLPKKKTSKLSSPRNRLLEKIALLVESHKCSYECCDEDGNQLGTCQYDIARDIRALMDS